MKYISLSLLVALVIIGLTGCPKPVVQEYDYQEVADGINHFTFEFLPLLDGQNIFFSPYSISSALAMTYAGAKGNTAAEMSGALHFGEDQKVFHPSFALLNEELEMRKREGITLNNANALWVDHTAMLEQNYLNLTNRNYSAGAERVNFIGETEESRIKINEWIEEKTEDKIKDLLSPGDVTPDTRMILTNAIYFLGTWQSEFSPEATREQYFFPTPDNSVRIPFMRSEGDYKYADHDNFRMLEISYTGEELAMVIVLPQENIQLSEVIAGLDYEIFAATLEALTLQEIDLQIPKFKFETKYNLKEHFRKLGMIDAFSGNADFTGMTGRGERFFIDEIIHQAFVEVDEKGTEAAAATAVVMRTTSIESQRTMLFRADRPFLFFIRDTVSNTILFTGALYKP